MSAMDDSIRQQFGTLRILVGDSRCAPTGGTIVADQGLTRGTIVAVRQGYERG
jgi:hypothetical protein